MKKINKRIMAVLLTIIMLIGSVAMPQDFNGITAYGAETSGSMAASGDNAVTEENDAVTVSGTNSVGSLLTAEIDGQLQQQEDNAGYNIFEVTVEGKMATVSLETLKDCELIVGIYSEDGKELLASGTTDIEKGAKEAALTLDTESMPQYFLVKAFLVDDTMSPLCPSYESERYTQEMQEFLTKTTDDFAQERVLNLDEDKTNNFAVYNNEVKRLETGSNKNLVVSADDKTGIYVLQNVDSSVIGLKSGDIFSCDNHGAELIVKVDSVTLSGTTATIYGQDTSLEEVFDYVKIDNDSDLSKAEIQEAEGGMIYNGLSDSTEEPRVAANVDAGIMPAFEAGDTKTKEASFDFPEKKAGNDEIYAKVSGGLKLTAAATVKVYITKNVQFLEVRLDNSIKLNIVFEAAAVGEIEIADIGLEVCPGVHIGFVPSIVFDANLKLELGGELKTTVGFRYDSEKGFENISSSPQYDKMLDIEGHIYVGLRMQPYLTIFTENVSKADITAEVGAVITAKADNGKSEEYIHECNACIAGDISAKIDVSAGVKFLNSDELSFRKKLVDDKKIKIEDFYCSITFGKMHFGKCPYKKYRVLVILLDMEGEKLEGTKVTTGDYAAVADEKGEAEFYLPDGTYTFKFALDGYKTKTLTVTVVEAAETKMIILDKANVNEDTGSKAKGQTVSLGSDHSAAVTEDGSLYMWGKNYYGQLGDGSNTDRNTPQKIMENVASIVIGGVCSAAITMDGSLYMWGDNYYGKLGDGTTQGSNIPIKIMDNVVSVSLSRYHSAAIRKDGSLYVWGANSSGQLGDGSNDNKNTPQKIMENVVSVALGSVYSAAITEDGSLYMWGNNYYGQLGDGSNTDKNTPQKIMENVASVALGYAHNAAVTEDGSLYMWGDNRYGELGDGSNDNKNMPQKIMENVARVELGYWHSAAITEDRSLYMWGDNRYGELGDGSNDNKNTPQKIMENVASIALGDNNAAITWDGSLYMWGDNRYGELGDGSSERKNTPQKIMENVASVALGDSHSAAVIKDGSLYMWGNNGEGRLGDGSNDNKNTPQKIMDNIMLPTYTSEFSLEPMAAVYTENELPVENFVQTTALTSEVAPYKYTGLTAGTEYMLYIVKSDEAGENILSADNILYLNQAKADENGNLQFDVAAQSAWGNPEVLLIGGAGDGNIIWNATEQLCGGIAVQTTSGQLQQNLHKRFELRNSMNAEITDKEAVISTGDIICLLDKNGETAGEYTVYIKGDLDGDGSISVMDMEALQKDILGIKKLTGAYEKAGLLSGADTLSVIDMEVVQKHILGIAKIE